MAKIKLYNNIFEEEFEEFEVKTGSSVVESVEEKINKKIYKETLVECYDSETGETFFAPIEDEESESISILVNGNYVDKDYIVKENDLVTVVFLPAGDNAGQIIGTIVGVIGGIIMGVLTVMSGGAALGIAAGAISVGAKLFGGFLGGVVGGLVGMFTGKMIDQLWHRAEGVKSQKGLQEGSQAPDVRGSNNTTLRGNNYPFLFGKHLITPFIVGDPYTTYSGTRGRDAYIRVLLCAGYAPLKLTEFKLGEFLLSYNKPHSSVTQETVISGLLKGYSTGGIADNGDILDIWKNNDIELEIIQQDPNYPVDYGTIYSDAVDDQQIDANVLFVADKSLADAAAVTYKGVSFPNAFRTNGVFFTASCPREFTVTLDFPNGIYSSYNYTAGNVSQALYGDIPLWICAQWRPYNKNNATSKSDGSDYASWNNIDFGYSHLFDTDAAKADTIAHLGNDFSTYYHGEIWQDQWVRRVKLNEYKQEVWYDSWEPVLIAAEGFVPTLYQNWVGKTLQNFQTLSGGLDGMSQTRVTATISLTKEQCLQMISEDNPTQSIEIRVLRISPCYLNMTHSLNANISAINYSDLVKVSSIVTKTFDADTLRNEDTVVPVRVQSEADMKKFCFIALKAKADASGYIINQLSKINCIAESFSPYWNMTSKKIMPEGIHKVTNYYGYFDSNNNKCNRSDTATEVVVTKQEYETARHEGYNWYEEKAGSNYTDIIKSIIFSTRTTHNERPCYFLTPEASNYNNNCVSSSFLLACMGAQSGPEACGIEDINILSIADWAETTDALTDGSTFPVATVYRGHSYAKGDLIPVHYEANGYIYSGVKFEDLLSKLAICGRAAWIIDETGKIKVIMDKPVDYIKGAISLQDCVQSSNNFTYESIPAGLFVSFADENDGYENNAVYCWSDGNSIKNYHGTVEPCNIDFVTSPYQIHSLGRYFLACRVMQKENLSRKVGVNGELYSIGDVVLVQSNELLIGETSGRIQEVIEIEGVIQGVVTDSEYEYTGELDSDGNSKQGVTIIQPGYMGKSRTVTIPLSGPRSIIINETVIDEGVPHTIQKTYTLKPGITNVVLFGKVPGQTAEYGVEKSGDDPSTTLITKYNFKTGDVCLFGLIDKIAAPYRITKIKPEKGGTFTENLIPYDESLYNYGAVLPEFQNYITPPKVEDTAFSLSEMPVTLSDKVWEKSQELNNVGFLKDYEPPSIPTDISIVAYEDRIAFKWNVSDITTVKSTVIERSLNFGATWTQIGSSASQNWDYYFIRDIDGYPEKEDLQGMWFRLKNISIYDVSSEYTSSQTVDVTEYLTWIPQMPTVATPRINHRTVTLNFSQSTPCYGALIYLVSIQRYDEFASQYPIWFKPELNADPYGSTEAYKDPSASEYFEVGGKRYYYLKSANSFTQTLPLEHQIAEQNYQVHRGDGELEDYEVQLTPTSPVVKYTALAGTEVTQSIDTNYYYRIWCLNATTGVYSAEYTQMLITAKATSAYDIVDSAIITNKIADGAVIMDKLHANCITAEKMATRNLTALGAFIGSIYGGEIDTNPYLLASQFIPNKTYYLKNDALGTWYVAPIQPTAQTFVPNYYYLPNANYTKPIGKVNNYWKDLDDYTPEFRIGNDIDAEMFEQKHKYFLTDAEYMHWVPESRTYQYTYVNPETGVEETDYVTLARGLYFKIANFVVTAVESIIKGVFRIRSKLTQRSFLEANPETSAQEDITAETLNVNGDVNIKTKANGSAGRLSVAGAISGNSLSGSSVSTNSVSVKNSNNTETASITSSGAISGASVSVSGAISGNGISSSSTISASGAISGASLKAKGLSIRNSADTADMVSIDSAGNLSAQHIGSVGSVSASGNVTAGQNITATGSVSGNGISSSSTISSTGNATIGGSLSANGITSSGNITASGVVSGANVRIPNGRPSSIAIGDIWIE